MKPKTMFYAGLGWITFKAGKIFASERPARCSPAQTIGRNEMTDDTTEPEYETIRRAGGESGDAPSEPDEPEYESIRRQGGEDPEEKEGQANSAGPGYSGESVARDARQGE